MRVATRYDVPLELLVFDILLANIFESESVRVLKAVLGEARWEGCECGVRLRAGEGDVADLDSEKELKLNSKQDERKALTLRLFTITVPNESFSPNISYTIPPSGALMRSTNHWMSAAEAAGVMYTRTHSKRRRVGREGERMSGVRAAKAWSGGWRRSAGRRWYMAEWRPMPPLTVRAGC